MWNIVAGLDCRRNQAGPLVPMKTVLIIPALNEERAIGHVLSEVPRGIYAQIIVGSRVLGEAEPGALGPHQRWGNALATFLIRL